MDGVGKGLAGFGKSLWGGVTGIVTQPIKGAQEGGLAGFGKGVGKGGRKLSYVATVQGNGNLLIGKAYTAMLDLKPGDEFEIKLGRKQIRLIPAGAPDEDEE